MLKSEISESSMTVDGQRSADFIDNMYRTYFAHWLRALPACNAFFEFCEHFSRSNTLNLHGI